MSAYVLLNLLNKLRKRYKMRAFITFSERVEFNNTRARMLDSIFLYDIKITLKSLFWHKK